jgi:putative transposase of IS4/5 family DUF4096
VQRLLWALHAPPERWTRHLAWSTFRRRHQAVAQHCHRQRRQRAATEAGAQPEQPGPVAVQRVAERWRDLSEDLWQRIQPVLPPQKPPRGRPGDDQRQLLAGMLWAMAAGASWREVPARFAPWHTVYACYQRWRKAGIWEQIVALLYEGEYKSKLGP